MEFQLVRLHRAEQPTLSGLFAKKKMARGTLVHVHGMGSNFSENEFLDLALREYWDAGFSVATLSFPGSDRQHRTEHYEEFTPALDDWLDELDIRDHLILQGHSLGNHKILSYETDDRARHREQVRAISLLGPIDEIATWGTLDTKIQKERLNWVREQCKSSGPDGLIYDKAWMYWAMSARVMEELLTPGSLIDRISTRDQLQDLGWSSVPRFLAIGEHDQYSVPSAAEVVEMASKLDHINAHLIANCDHDFISNFVELSRELRRWIDSLHI